MSEPVSGTVSKYASQCPSGEIDQASPGFPLSRSGTGPATPSLRIQLRPPATPRTMCLPSGAHTTLLPLALDVSRVSVPRSRSSTLANPSPPTNSNLRPSGENLGRIYVPVAATIGLVFPVLSSQASCQFLGRRLARQIYQRTRSGWRCGKIELAAAGEPPATAPAGRGGANAAYGPAIIKYLEGKGISWTVWCFDPEWGPTLIRNWNYELTPSGEFAKAAMNGEIK